MKDKKKKFTVIIKSLDKSIDLQNFNICSFPVLINKGFESHRSTKYTITGQVSRCSRVAYCRSRRSVFSHLVVVLLPHIIFGKRLQQYPSFAFSFAIFLFIRRSRGNLGCGMGHFVVNVVTSELIIAHC